MTNENPAMAAIRKAQEQAKDVAPIEMTKVSEGQGSNAVATYGAAMPATLETLTSAGMNVDAWLKCPEHGFQIDNKKGFVEEIIVSFVPRQQAVFHGVRFGNPATYLKSFDGVNCVQGGSWTDAVKRAQAADDKCRGSYVGIDLQMTIEEDVIAPSGDVLLEKGKRLGHSTSVTGGKTVADFMRDAMAKGFDNDELKVKLVFVQKTKQGVKPWGVIGMELIENLSPTE